MKISFELIELPLSQNRLVKFLTSEDWPFHVNRNLTPDKVLEMIIKGTFDGTNHESFWILDELKNEIGFIRLFDLDDIGDGYPLFDLRIRSEYRGRGLGKVAVQWLTKYLFEKHLLLERIVGTTRADNMAMRKILRTSGFVKEGHFRKDWSSSNDKCFDTVRYALLREDWASGTTTPVPWNDEL